MGLGNEIEKNVLTHLETGPNSDKGGSSKSSDMGTGNLKESTT